MVEYQGYVVVVAVVVVVVVVVCEKSCDYNWLSHWLLDTPVPLATALVHHHCNLQL